MRYLTVFDLSETASVDWRVATICSLLMLVGIAAVASRGRFAEWTLWPKATRRFAAPFSVLFLLMALAISTSIIWSSIASRHDLLAQNRVSSRVVEGPVRDFIPAPSVGHSDESFCVQEKCFSYSDYALTGGFNTTASHGGPIKDGLPVRVTYVGDLITRLEVGVSEQR